MTRIRLLFYFKLILLQFNIHFPLLHHQLAQSGISVLHAMLDVFQIQFHLFNLVAQLQQPSLVLNLLILRLHLLVEKSLEDVVARALREEESGVIDIRNVEFEVRLGSHNV